ncbi:hypothetical protein AA313_de0202635 [Arthrobotrys entomopaga]|nr:hypothetical protein AA313_de0202635 [Arthrobotrys entomopaga]
MLDLRGPVDSSSSSWVCMASASVSWGREDSRPVKESWSVRFGGGGSSFELEVEGRWGIRGSLRASSSASSSLLRDGGSRSRWNTRARLDSRFEGEEGGLATPVGLDLRMDIALEERAAFQLFLPPRIPRSRKSVTNGVGLAASYQKE